MRKLIVMGLLVLFCASLSVAQTVSGGGGPEVFVGYSNLQAEGLPEPNESGSVGRSLFGQRTGLHGINTEITGYFTPRFGLTGDFSYNQRNRNFTDINTGGGNIGTGSLKTRVLEFMGGPTVRFPNTTRATPFLHALFGVANTRFEAETRTVLTSGTVTNNFNTSSTDFAMALGGGLDVRVNERVGIRAVQLDYNPVFLRDRSVNVLSQAGVIQPARIEGQRQDNIRLSFGVTFK